jgi:hypothetical protein
MIWQTFFQLIKINKMLPLKFFLLVPLTLATIMCRAQETEDEIQVMQGMWGMEKRDVISKVMMLSEKDSARFWPIYAKYEGERKKVGHSRVLMIKDYSEHYNNLTNAKADELVKKLMKNDQDYSLLMTKYYNTLKTSMGAVKAAKFLQVENYLHTQLKAGIQDELPFIGQMESMKKN